MKESRALKDLKENLKVEDFIDDMLGQVESIFRQEECRTADTKILLVKMPCLAIRVIGLIHIAHKRGLVESCSTPLEAI